MSDSPPHWAARNRRHTCDLLHLWSRHGCLGPPCPLRKRSPRSRQRATRVVATVPWPRRGSVDAFRGDSDRKAWMPGSHPRSCGLRMRLTAHPGDIESCRRGHSRSLRVRRRGRHLRLRHEHPGDHRRARGRSRPHVRLSWLLQRRQHCRILGGQRVDVPERIALDSGVRRRRRYRTDPGLRNTASPALRGSVIQRHVSPSARDRHGNRRLVLHYVRGGRLRTRLERCVPHNTQHRSVYGRLGLCGLFGPHDDRTLLRR
jgi:hypothetical protein